MHSDKIKLDLSKYKRFFSFGCSFTEYRWPTWADIISKEIPEYYNYGKPGAGNFYIFSSIVEADKKYNFNEDDLVMVMWTAIDREDRYLENGWKPTGCVYHSIDDFYDKDFVKKYVDARGMFLRDVTCLSAATTLLRKTNFYYMSMVKFSSSEEIRNNDIVDFYKDDIDLILPDVMKVIHDGNWIEHARMKIKLPNGKLVRDLHPTPLYHLEYLQKTFDLELTEETIEFVNYHEKWLSTVEYIHDYDVYPFYNRPYIERL